MRTSTAPAEPVTALVLAGQRSSGDPLTDAAGIRLKALLPVRGRPMVERVVEALAGSSRVGRIAVSIPEPAALDRLPVDAVMTRPSVSLSVLAGIDELGTPLFVTTADHALLTTPIVDAFLEAAMAGPDDLFVGLVERRPIETLVPDTRRTYWRFRDGAFSGANLFFLRTPGARAAVTFWRRVEQERKRPWRIARAFGPRLLLGYLARRFTLAAAMQRASARLGCRVAAIVLPFGEAAIDVDKPADVVIVERLLDAREAATP